MALSERVKEKVQQNVVLSYFTFHTHNTLTKAAKKEEEYPTPCPALFSPILLCKSNTDAATIWLGYAQASAWPQLLINVKY